MCGAHGPTNNQVSVGGAGKIVVALDGIARAGASVIRSLSDQLKMMADGCEAKCGLYIETVSYTHLTLPTKSTV